MNQHLSIQPIDNTSQFQVVGEYMGKITRFLPFKSESEAQDFVSKVKENRTIRRKLNIKV